MFSKLSRYYKLPDVAVPDVHGRVLAAKDLRLLPQVTGTFQHTVQGGDRLDHLSYKYYNQPLQWWHICDANPQFLSPLSLLGDEVIVTTRFPLTISGGGAPAWGSLFYELYSVVGVEYVQVIEIVEIMPQAQVIGGQTVTVLVDSYSWAVLVTYNRLNVRREMLADRIEAAGFDHAQESVEIGQVGHEIVIPPKVIG